MRRPHAVSVTAAVAALAALAGCVGGAQALPVTITGPLETSDGALRVTGEAVDAELICPEVTWEGRVYEDLDGNELTLEDLEHMSDDAKDVRWTDSFACSDGSGSFAILHQQLLSRGEMDFEGYNEAASWEIASGTGSYAELSGEGTFILDFVDGVVVNAGEITAGG